MGQTGLCPRKVIFHDRLRHFRHAVFVDENLKLLADALGFRVRWNDLESGRRTWRFAMELDLLRPKRLREEIALAHVHQWKVDDGVTGNLPLAEPVEPVGSSSETRSYLDNAQWFVAALEVAADGLVDPGGDINVFRRFRGDQRGANLETVRAADVGKIDGNAKVLLDLLNHTRQPFRQTIPEDPLLGGFCADQSQ